MENQIAVLGQSFILNSHVSDHGLFLVILALLLVVSAISAIPNKSEVARQEKVKKSL